MPYCVGLVVTMGDAVSSNANVSIIIIVIFINKDFNFLLIMIISTTHRDRLYRIHRMAFMY